MRFRIIAFAAVLAVVAAPGAAALDLIDDVQPPDGEVGTPHTFQFEAEEGCVPYRFSYSSGTVPPGLRITEDGKLTGTPTEAGIFQFYAAVDDSVDCMSQQSQGKFTMEVLPDLAVGTTSLPRATPGQAYTTTLTATNTEVGWPLVWDITQGTLPQGLTLSENGVISGTPTGPDSKALVIRVREPFRRSGERQLTLTVVEPLTVRPGSTLSPPFGRIGVQFGFRLSASGGAAPLTWSVVAGTLPRGLTLDSSTGSITGVPRAAGRFALTFAVTDAADQRATTTQAIRIVSRLRIETKRLVPALIGRTYEAHLGTGGVLRLSRVQWTIVRGALPSGIHLERYTGELRGAPRETGTFRFTVEARELPGGATATKTFVLVVRP